MSEPTTTQTNRQHQAAIPLHATQILINLVVTLLAPMFLTAAGGDLNYARMAAAETVEAYRAQTQADLILIAQIVAFGLAALGSLSLSMEDNLSLSMTLRLRANANACNRSAEQNRRALKQSHAEAEIAPSPTPTPEADPEPGFNEAELVAAVAATHKRTAENLAQFSAPQVSVPQASIPMSAPPPPAVALTTGESHYQAAWAASAATVAAETIAELASLPPQERRAATIWATALNDCANDLLAGNLPPRPSSSDLAAIMRPSGI